MAQHQQNPQGHKSGRDALLLFLFLLSGSAALVYEVLWLKELGLLFGNTSYAAATTLGAFFLGLSAGAFFWGGRASAVRNPLRTYALLEFGICLSALLYLLVVKAYYSVYPALFDVIGDFSFLFLAVKFLLAAGLLFLPAFFMGGTFPVMGEEFIRRREMLGRRGTILYAVNTIGASIGAFVAGFYLPITFGYHTSYLLVCSLNAVIALTAYGLSCSQQVLDRATAFAPNKSSAAPAKKSPALFRLVSTIAFLSGFITLSLEVLWTQMFKQVLQNSVYSFSAVLVIFLVSLAAGSVVANGLCRLKVSAFKVMTTLMFLSGISIYLTPIIFYQLTDGLAEVSLAAAWDNYVLAIFGLAAMVILLPCTILGTIFPYLLRMYQERAEGAGQTIGKLAAINTVGAILGSLCAGFILASYVGIWSGIKLMAVLYFVMAAFSSERMVLRNVAAKLALGGGLVAFFLFVMPFSFPVVKVSSQHNEVLYRVWQGNYGTVAVIRRGSDLKIKINNTYDIGGSASVSGQTWQARIPLFLHPDPKRVFFLGMGTGITAGAALDHPVEKVLVCELIPEVVKASHTYFGPVTNGLFDDPRADVIVEDGRNYLLGSKDKFDVIISDLFTPWHAGIGSLYTAEHFRTVRDHLAGGGLFAQWLPLAQLSRREFLIIARTMTEVFPQLTMWRLNTPTTGPIVALIGQQTKKPLNVAALNRNVKQVLGANGTYVLPYIYYVGNLKANEALLARYPINTENRPIIEYLSPVTRQKAITGAERHFTDYEFIRFYEKLLDRLPPERDPFLRGLQKQQYDYIHAGMDLYKIDFYRSAGMVQEARMIYRDYLSHLSLDIYPELR